MQRSDQVGDEIRTVVAGILRTGIKDPRLPDMVSVVEVRASRDLSHAHIYVSVLGTEKQKKDCLAALQSASGFIRREITRKVRLRIAPELHFEIDESIARGIHMSQMIDQAMEGTRETAAKAAAAETVKSAESSAPVSQEAASKDTENPDIENPEEREDA